MEINGTQLIAAPLSVVWNALNDPSVLQRCLPGCESVEHRAPDEFRVVMASADDLLRARFEGLLKLTQADAPNSYVMDFRAHNGAVGVGESISLVELREVPAGTELRYTVKAPLGTRLIDSAQKMADDFFEVFNQQLTPAQLVDRDTAAMSNRDYLMALSGALPEIALSELPPWAWFICVAVMAVLTAVIVRLN